jgi:hypothetical protein
LRTAKIREAARRSFVAALNELPADQQKSVVHDLMLANSLEVSYVEDQVTDLQLQMLVETDLGELSDNWTANA